VTDSCEYGIEFLVHKMLGNSWVAAQRAASQQELTFMKLLLFIFAFHWFSLVTGYLSEKRRGKLMSGRRKEFVWEILWEKETNLAGVSLFLNNRFPETKFWSRWTLNRITNSF
jgi:hypothetical protein